MTLNTSGKASDEAQPTQDGVSFCENCDQITQWFDNECQRCKQDGYGYFGKSLNTNGKASEEAPELTEEQVMEVNSEMMPPPEPLIAWARRMMARSEVIGYNEAILHVLAIIPDDLKLEIRKLFKEIKP